MPGQFLEDPSSTLERAREALRSGCEPTWTALSRSLDLPRGTLAHRMNSLGVKTVGEVLTYNADNEKQAPGDYYETIEINEAGEIDSDRLITIFEQDAKDPAALMLAHGFAPEEWELIGATSNMWHGMRANDEGQLVNMQSKIRVRPLRVKALTTDDIEAFLSTHEGGKSPITMTKAGKSGGVVVEFNIADLHIGNGTRNIEERVAHIIGQVLDEVSGLDVLKFYLIVLGDFFHYDTLKRHTSGGTPLEYDMMPADMFETGERVLINAIDTLSSIAPVELVGINGNHDELLSFAVYRTLKAWYRDTLGVFIDAEKAHTKHREFGNSLVMWAHGQVPTKRLQKMIYHEAREEFGRTTHAEIHSGHLHSQTVQEEGGVILRRLPALTDTDEWHKKSGFVGSQRASMGFVWDLDRGLKRIFYANP